MNIELPHSHLVIVANWGQACSRRALRGLENTTPSPFSPSKLKVRTRATFCLLKDYWTVLLHTRAVLSVQHRRFLSRGIRTLHNAARAGIRVHAYLLHGLRKPEFLQWGGERETS